MRYHFISGKRKKTVFINKFQSYCFFKNESSDRKKKIFFMILVPQFFLNFYAIESEYYLLHNIPDKLNIIIYQNGPRCTSISIF